MVPIPTELGIVIARQTDKIDVTRLYPLADTMVASPKIIDDILASDPGIGRNSLFTRLTDRLLENNQHASMMGHAFNEVGNSSSAMEKAMAGSGLVERMRNVSVYFLENSIDKDFMTPDEKEKLGSLLKKLRDDMTLIRTIQEVQLAAKVGGLVAPFLDLPRGGDVGSGGRFDLNAYEPDYKFFGDQKRVDKLMFLATP